MVTSLNMKLIFWSTTRMEVISLLSSCIIMLKQQLWEYKTGLTLFLWHFTEEGPTLDAIMVLSTGLKASNPPSLCSEICHCLFPNLRCHHSFSYDHSFCDLSLRYWIATSHAAMIWYIHSRLGMIPLVPCLMYANQLPRITSASLYIFSLNWALLKIIN